LEKETIPFIYHALGCWIVRSDLYPAATRTDNRG